MIRNEEIKMLREQGKTLQEIGDTFNLSKERIRQIIKVLGLQPRLVYVKVKPIDYSEKIKARLLSRIKENTFGCWEFQGYKSPLGYGKLSYNGYSQYAHRVSYQIFNKKQIPNNISVIHICKNKDCINPDHLYLGTQRDSRRYKRLDKKNITC